MSVTRVPVTIAISTSLSPAVKIRPSMIDASPVTVAIAMPAAWDAGNLTFQVSHDGGTTFNNVHDDAGNELTVTADAARYIVLSDAKMLRGVTDLKVRSGTSGTPVNQTAARTLTLISIEA